MELVQVEYLIKLEKPIEQDDADLIVDSNRAFKDDTAVIIEKKILKNYLKVLTKE